MSTGDKSGILAISASLSLLLRRFPPDSTVARQAATKQVLPKNTLEKVEWNPVPVPREPQTAPTYYIGSIEHALDHGSIERLGITHIVNCCCEFINFWSTDTIERLFNPILDADSPRTLDSYRFLLRGLLGNIDHSAVVCECRNTCEYLLLCRPANYRSLRYYHIRARDKASEKLSDHLPGLFKFLDAIPLDNSGAAKVLFHCKAGRSRSVSFLTAYLMHRYRISLDQAFRSVESVRRVAKPNDGFCMQLVQLHGAIFPSQTHVQREIEIFSLTSLMLTPIASHIHQLFDHLYSAYSAGCPPNPEWQILFVDRMRRQKYFGCQSTILCILLIQAVSFKLLLSATDTAITDIVIKITVEILRLLLLKLDFTPVAKEECRINLKRKRQITADEFALRINNPTQLESIQYVLRQRNLSPPEQLENPSVDAIMEMATLIREQSYDALVHDDAC